TNWDAQLPESNFKTRSSVKARTVSLFTTDV
ncbi:DUF6783 domain-containing protein, partial [uncultured Robinsoniella sp.]